MDHHGSLFLFLQRGAASAISGVLGHSPLLEQRVYQTKPVIYKWWILHDEQVLHHHVIAITVRTANK